MSYYESGVSYVVFHASPAARRASHMPGGSRASHRCLRHRGNTKCRGNSLNFWLECKTFGESRINTEFGAKNDLCLPFEIFVLILFQGPPTPLPLAADRGGGSVADLFSTSLLSLHQSCHKMCKFLQFFWLTFFR